MDKLNQCLNYLLSDEGKDKLRMRYGDDKARATAISDIKAIMAGQKNPWKQILAYAEAGMAEEWEIVAFHDFLASLIEEKRKIALNMTLKEINESPEFNW